MIANYTPEDIRAVLPDEYKVVASRFIALAEKHNLKPDVRHNSAKAAWKCAYTLKKPKRILFTVWTAPEEFRIKANLRGVDQYLSNCALSEEIKCQMLDNALDCADCEKYRCSGVQFSLDGQPYKKCIFGAFTFIDLSVEGFHMVAELIEREIESVVQK